MRLGAELMWVGQGRLARAAFARSSRRTNEFPCTKMLRFATKPAPHARTSLAVAPLQNWLPRVRLGKIDPLLCAVKRYVTGSYRAARPVTLPLAR